VREIPTLRDKQIEQLAFYMGNPKCLDLSDPGTGKTPPCCVYSFWVWDSFQKKTLWTMPKSLLRKNLGEMLRFTEFCQKDVVILRTDRANLTQKWTGPVISSTRTRRGWKLADGSNTIDRKGCCYIDFKFPAYGPPTAEWVMLGPSLKRKPWTYECPGDEVEPLLGPDGQPLRYVRHDPEDFKDLIADAAQQGAKVVICTFAFASAHWKRLIENFPDMDLFLVDELHMGYGGPESNQTESFYWINRHVSRFVGMTGTLINGRLDSAYPAISVIEPRYYGSLQGFYFEHAAVVDDYGRVVVWKNENKLRQILARHSIRRTFEEVYGEEPVAFYTQYVEVDESVKVHYDKFHEEALLELEDGRVLDGALPGVSLIRARQILGHPETMLNNIPKWTGKDERVEILLSEGKKTLIFAALVPEQERLVKLCESLGLRVALINNTVHAKERDRIDQLAQEGKLDVIVGSGPTVAVGYNWEMFDIVIFVSIDYMDVNILQAYRRASRGTRTSILRVYFLRYADTIDDRQYDIVKAKSQLANRVDETRPVLEFTETE